VNPSSRHFSERLSRILPASFLSLASLLLSATGSALAGESQLSLCPYRRASCPQSGAQGGARALGSRPGGRAAAQTLPDPRLQIGYQRMSMVPPVVEGVMYGVGQDIPFPGNLKLEDEVAQRDAERLEQEYNATRLRLVAALKQVYYDLH